jgi:hypothetical protein
MKKEVKNTKAILSCLSWTPSYRMTLDTMQKKLTYSGNACFMSHLPFREPCTVMVSGQPDIRAEYLGDAGLQGKEEDQEVDEEKEKEKAKKTTFTYWQIRYSYHYIFNTVKANHAITFVNSNQSLIEAPVSICMKNIRQEKGSNEWSYGLFYIYTSVHNQNRVHVGPRICFVPIPTNYFSWDISVQTMDSTSFKF